MIKSAPFLLALLSLFSTGCQRSSSCCVLPEVVEESYVHKYGLEVTPEDWAMRGQCGQVISTLKNGVKETKTYSEGELDGEALYTYAHRDEVEKKEVYSAGQKMKQITYYLSGAPKEEVEHVSPGIDHIKRYYEMGGIESEEEIHDGLLVQGAYYTPTQTLESRVDDREGIRSVRDLYGQLVAKETIEGGKLALRTTYYPNSTPKEQIPYSDGNIHGQKKLYLPGGEPLAIETWVNGRQEGVAILFANGEKVSEVPYVNGQKHGVEKKFKDSSAVVQEISWERGQQHGPFTSYIGSTAQTDWYFQGRPVSKLQYDRLTNPPLK